MASAGPAAGAGIPYTARPVTPAGAGRRNACQLVPPSCVTNALAPPGPPAVQPSRGVAKATGAAIGIVRAVHMTPPSWVLNRSPRLNAPPRGQCDREPADVVGEEVERCWGRRGVGVLGRRRTDVARGPGRAAVVRAVDDELAQRLIVRSGHPRREHPAMARVAEEDGPDRAGIDTRRRHVAPRRA